MCRPCDSPRIFRESPCALPLAGPGRTPCSDALRRSLSRYSGAPPKRTWMDFGAGKLGTDGDALRNPVNGLVEHTKIGISTRKKKNVIEATKTRRHWAGSGARLNRKSWCWRPNYTRSPADLPLNHDSETKKIEAIYGCKVLVYTWHTTYIDVHLASGWLNHVQSQGFNHLMGFSMK